MWTLSRERKGLDGAQRVGCFVALVGALALALSAELTWASWSLAGDGISRSLLELPVVPLLLGAAVVVILGTALAGLAGDPRALEVGGHVAAGVALFAALFLVAAETLTTVVPELHIPGTAHRLALGTAAGPGPWLALVAGASVAVAAIASLREQTLALVSRLAARSPSPIVAVIVFGATVPALLLLRAETWLAAKAFGGELSLSGETLGYVAWPALVAPFLLAAAIACVCSGRFELGALIGALAGWATNISAALTVVFAETLARVPVREAHATASVWLAFALGFAPAAAAAALLWWGGERR